MSSAQCRDGQVRAEGPWNPPAGLPGHQSRIRRPSSMGTGASINMDTLTGRRPMARNGRGPAAGLLLDFTIKALPPAPPQAARDCG